MRKLPWVFVYSESAPLAALASTSDKVINQPLSLEATNAPYLEFGPSADAKEILNPLPVPSSSFQSFQPERSLSWKDDLELSSDYGIESNIYKPTSYSETFYMQNAEIKDSESRAYLNPVDPRKSSSQHYWDGEWKNDLRPKANCGAISKDTCQQASSSEVLNYPSAETKPNADSWRSLGRLSTPSTVGQRRWGSIWETDDIGYTSYNAFPYEMPVDQNDAGNLSTRNAQEDEEDQGFLGGPPNMPSLDLSYQTCLCDAPEQVPPTLASSERTLPVSADSLPYCSMDISRPGATSRYHSSLDPVVEEGFEHLERGNKRSLSISSSVVSGASRSRQKLNSQPSSQARMPSFRSFSSSQRNDIVSVLGRLTLSSGNTKCSSAFTSALDLSREDQVSVEYAEEGRSPRAISLVDLYALESPTDLPSHILNSRITLVKPHDMVCHQGNCPCEFCNGSMLSFIDAFLGGNDMGVWKNDLVITNSSGLDRLNHTALHVAAALGAVYSVLDVFITRGLDLNAVNTAGQTFLHLLNPSTLASTGTLPKLLHKVRDSDFDFSKTDHQGSNVLQILLQHPLHEEVLEEVFEVLSTRLPLMTSRDNLGHCVQSRLVYLVQCAITEDPGRARTISRILQKYFKIDPDFYGSSAFDVIPHNFSKDNAQMLEALISNSIANPQFEDIYGRNGLHCFRLHCYPQSKVDRSKQGLNKILKKAPRLKSREDDEHQSNDLTSSQFDQLLSAGTDVGRYDKTGKTPLLAFLYYSPLTDKDDDAIVKERVTKLVKAGASVHSRDRNGETPLHIAVKRGIITATRVLVAHGANVNARQKDGKGVVRLALETADEMRRYKNLHIRIMTCVNLVVESGAKETPDLFEEWDAA